MSSGRNIIVWLVAILLLSSLMNHFSETAKKANYADLAFSEFMNEAENKRISEVTIAGANIEGKLTDGIFTLMRLMIRRWWKRCAKTA